jgi:hypothetical protein
MEPGQLTVYKSPHRKERLGKDPNNGHVICDIPGIKYDVLVCAGYNGNSSATLGGAGGSGIVVIRYPNTYPTAISTTGSPTVANTGGYRIYTWTSSGTITF